MRIKLFIKAKFRSVYLLALLFLIPVQVFGQQYYYKKYSVNNGLPHGQVHNVLQSSDGYMWIGTYGGGFAKFDGENFVVYDTEDGLKDNSVEVIFEDSQKNLWVSTYGSGIAKMEQNHFVYPFDDATLDTSDIYAIDELRDGELWIGTYRAGVYIYDGKKLERITTEDGLINNTVWDFWEADNGNMWIATSTGISVYDGNTFKNYTQADGLSGESIYRIVKHSNGNLWFASSKGITIWDGKSFSALTEVGGVKLDYIYDLIAASDGTMWIGTYANGVIAYTDSNSVHYSKKNGLSSNYIYDLYEDDEENIWIATDGEGINLYQGDDFVLYGTESGLRSPVVYSLFKDSEGRRWAGTEEGIFLYKNKRFEQQPLPAGYDESKEIWDIVELANGDLLFLMPDNTIYRYDGKSFANYSRLNNLELWFTYDLYVDKDNSLWIATDVGLFHKKNGRLKQYTRNDGLPSSIIYQIYAHNGYLWIATYNGVSRFDGKKFTNYTRKDGIGHSEISSIIADNRGNIWLGTGAGITLLQLDKEGTVSSIENFGKETGMKIVSTMLLWFDESGRLWQGTNGGLHLLDVPGYWQTGEMNLFHYRLSEKGIGIETNQHALFPLDSNKVWLGTTDGVLEIDGDAGFSQSNNIQVHIANVTRNSQQVDWNAYTDSIAYQFGRPTYPEVTFPYGHHTYSINYDALIYGNTSNKKYRYKLQGFEDKWSQPIEQETVTFTNLSPGSYNFIVQAKNGGSQWSSNEASFSFSVDYPYWQTYWFYVLLLLSFLGLLYTYIRVRLGLLEKRKLKEMVEEQTTDLKKALNEKEVLVKEIHHRVKNNLAVISGLLELQLGYVDNEHVDKVLRESQRRILSISMIHEKLYQNEQLSEIDFKKYIHELVNIIEYSFSHIEKDIQTNIEVEEDISLSIDQGIPCGLILNELVSNAYEHAFVGRESGKIEISFTSTDDEITLQIRDNGIGMKGYEPDQARDSLGITLVETLVKQLEGDLDVETSTRGTVFSITFTNTIGQERSVF